MTNAECTCIRIRHSAIRHSRHAPHPTPHAQRLPRLSAAGDAAREQIIDTARRVFRSYGFSPIDTPALEYLEILLGKGGAETDKQLYRFQDHGGRDVGLRFDLTVPLARFAAQHIAELGTPFKRYHIATVWRGENTQRGRYREFMQCDFDTIGTSSVAADVETVLVAHDLLRAIGFERFTIHVNNRLVLNGLLESLGLAERATDILRAIDKLAKIGAERVAEEMCQTAGASPEQAKQVVAMVQLTGTNDAILAQLRPLVGSSPARPRRHRPARRTVGRRARRRRPGATHQARCLHRPRSRLLHRHRPRNAARRQARIRQRLQRRPVR